MPGLPPLPPSRVHLLAPIWRSASGSEAFLALASDGRQYWVKAPDNPQGARTLVVEVVVHGIGRVLEAPMPKNVLVDIPAGLSFPYADGRPMRGGIGHGSLNVQDVVVSEEWGTYAEQDHNRWRQAFILAVWDLCLGVDPQWLHRTTDHFSMWSFDHGFWFAGEADWDLPSLRRIGTAPWQHDLDSGVASRRALTAAADAVAALDLTTLQTISGHVPLDWSTTAAELNEVATLIHTRVPGVVNRLRSAARQSRHP